jgi:hypothetical protein
MNDFTVRVNEILRDHRESAGMMVSRGSTCQCGYWTGNERAGVTRPVGIIDPLDWHRAELIEALLATQRADLAEQVRGLKVTGECYCADLIKESGCWLCEGHQIITDVLSIIEGEK